jgi:hypothetical protein
MRKVNCGASAICEASTTSRNSTTSAALQSAAVPELQSANAVPHPTSVIVERCSQLGGLGLYVNVAPGSSTLADQEGAIVAMPVWPVPAKATTLIWIASC